MTFLPTIPSKKTISHVVLVSQQNSPKFLTALANFQNVRLLGIPAGYSVTGIKMKLLTQFVVPGSTSLTVTLGLADANTFYATAFELTNPVTNTSFQITHTNFDGININDSDALQAHDIIAYFQANGSTFLNNVTQGEMECTISYRAIA